MAAAEDYWAEIRRAFDADRTLINLNHGGVAPASSAALDAMIRDLRFANVAPAHHMWDVLEPRVESVRREAAREFGCDPEELAVTRNASESMQTLIAGLDLKRGDEVIVGNQNYPRMLTAWDQRVRRDGVVVKRISFGGPNTVPEDVTPASRGADGEDSRGRDYSCGEPYGKHPAGPGSRGHGSRACAETFVDGAHAFAHFPFRRDDLGCDYYATSLHKWLLAPVGTGFLYVKKSAIPKVWPLMAAPESMTGDIRKFEEIGRTRPPITTQSPPPSRSTAPSVPTARSRDCATSAAAGQRGSLTPPPAPGFCPLTRRNAHVASASYMLKGSSRKRSRSGSGKSIGSSRSRSSTPSSPGFVSRRMLIPRSRRSMFSSTPC